MNVLLRHKVLQLYRRVVGLFYGKLAIASAWLFIGGILGGILGYVFHVIMGRMLSTQEYGLFSAFTALFSVLIAPLTALVMIVSRKVSEYRASQESKSITHFYYSINIRCAIAAGIAIGICVPFAQQLQLYLKSPNIMPVYLLCALLFLTLFPFINFAFLQGLQKFAWISLNSTLAVLFKIIFAVMFIWLGYGISGVLGGTILATLVGWFITYGALYRSLAEGRGKSFQTTHLTFKPAIPILVANTAFAAMTQLDIVLVNYYFPAHEAGLYAAAAILGKSVMYLSGSIANALFPMVAENHARNQNSAHLLLQAAGLTAVLCGIGAIIYLLFGGVIVSLLYGENYLGAGEVLTLYGFAVLPMALVMVAENFLIAKGRVLFSYLFLITAPLQLTAIYFYHDSLRMVVQVMGVSGLLLALIGFGLLWLEYKKTQIGS